MEMAANQARFFLTPSAPTTKLMVTGHANNVISNAQIVSPAIAVAKKPTGTNGDITIKAASFVSNLLAGNETA